jgi:hypothetical protein
MGSAAVRGLAKRRSERDRVLLAPSGGPMKARAPRLPVAAAICSPSNIPQRRATFASANWAAPGPRCPGPAARSDLLVKAPHKRTIRRSIHREIFDHDESFAG